MSYQVLARKWRPANFQQLVGQQQTAQALGNALQSQRLHHAYLFTGTRGVGKTTIARILAKSLNCEQGITATPCGECSSCLEITNGNFVDLLEIDAASKTKVEDTRELLDNVQYRPTRGRYKVYLIDEVHMLSGHSFNALLKTLEEPPPHVVFLLATTDPQKLPVTVLSRCLQFHLRRMSEPEIVNHLSMILEKEGIGFEVEALETIATGADGSMRDGLSLLDQAIAFCGDTLSTASVQDMLGTIDKAYAHQLLNALLSEDPVGLLQAIEKIAEFAPDFDELFSDWLSLLHKIAVCQVTGNNDDKPVLEFSQRVTAADLQLFYQLSLQAKRDLSYSPNPRQAFEMAMLRIMTFKPQSTQPAPGKKKQLNDGQQAGEAAEIAKPQPVETATTSLSSSEPLSQTTERPPIGDQQVPQNQPQNQPVAAEALIESAPIADSPNAHSVQEPEARLRMVVDNSAVYDKQSSVEDITDKSEITREALQPEIKTPIKKLSLEEVEPTNWHQVVESLEIVGNGLQILSNATAKFEQGILHINLLVSIEPLLTKNAEAQAVEALQTYFENSDVKIIFEPISETSETPKERKLRLHEIALDNAMQTLKADPQVSHLLEQMNGTIPRESITYKS